MLYRTLGNTGLRVSVFSLGNWVTGNNPTAENEIIQIAIMKRAFELGVNFFDTAEAYGAGVAETILGKAIKQFKCNRKDIVISTKILKSGTGENDTGMGRKHIIEALNNSLKRLDLSYVDIVFSHRPDQDTPLEETCRAFHTLVESGKAHYWGTSEWNPELIVEALWVCDKYSLHKPVVEQCQYNMLVRDRMEKEYELIFQKFRYGTTVFSPLASGILTGKYNNDIPDGSRFDKNKELQFIFDRFLGENKKSETLKILRGLNNIANEEGYSSSHLALAWAIANTDTSTCILGASKVAQLEDNMKGLELFKKWNASIEEKCNNVLNNTPTPSTNFRTFKPRQGRREIALVEQAKKISAKL